MANKHYQVDMSEAIVRLAPVSRRPRFALLVLQLIVEAANERGEAGPWIREPDGSRSTVREWLGRRLDPISTRSDRSGRARAADDTRALSVQRANISRAVSDLVCAGLVDRYYAGYATPHANRGGGRHAVYTLMPAAPAPATSSVQVMRERHDVQLSMF